MATKYLLPCSCGKAAKVDASQAGDTTSCECGKTLVVPTMRQLRDLTPAPVDGNAQKSTSSWTKREGLVFALGLLLLFVGLGIAGYFQFGRFALNTKETRYDNLEESLETIDEMNVSELWSVWSEVRDTGMGRYSPPPFVLNRYYSSKWLMIIWTGLGLACVGVVTCIIAFLMRKPAK